MRLFRLLIVTIIFFQSFILEAQSYFRMDYLYFRPVYAELSNGLGFSIGYDRATSDRTMWGATIFTTYNSLVSFLEMQSESVFTTSTGSPVDVYTYQNVFGLLVHSDYALSDMSSGHIFIGPTTGIIRVGYAQEIFGDERNKYSNYIVPLGLRVGFRAGEYLSLYVGGGHNFGNMEVRGNPELISGLKLRSNYYEAGLAYLF